MRLSVARKSPQKEEAKERRRTNLDFFAPFLFNAAQVESNIDLSARVKHPEDKDKR